MPRTLAAAAAAVLLFSCAPAEKPVSDSQKTEAPRAEAPKAGAPQIEELASPAAPGSSAPFLHAGRTGVHLSWLEPVAGTKRVAVRTARFESGRWSEPRTIVERDDLFANWADFPSIVEDAEGTLFAHWLQKSGDGTYAYDIRMATSTDGGGSWGQPFLLNRDGKEAEHGFVTLAALPDGGVGAAWLDGRKMTAGGHEGHGGGDMTLRYATVARDGTLGDEAELDARTCECCATGMAMASAGPVIVYRDRSDGEVRDIARVARGASGWTAPSLVNADGWEINACPVNGPQADAIGDRVATAWFTAAANEPRVFAAYSDDGGVTFGKPVRVDGGTPVGRVDVVLLDPETALVTWLEQTGSGAEVRARRVMRDGSAGTPVKIADSGTARSTGFTRIAKSGGEVYFAWTEQSGEQKRVRVGKGRF